MPSMRFRLAIGIAALLLLSTLVWFFPLLSLAPVLLAGLTGGAIILARVPPRLVADAGITDPKDRLTLENEIRKTLSQLLGGVAITVTLCTGIGSFLLQQRATHLAEERHRAESLARAVDVLQRSDATSPPRVGAIYSLGLLLQTEEKQPFRSNNDKLSYSKIVARVLSSFIQRNYSVHVKAQSPGTIDPRIRQSGRFRGNPRNVAFCAYKHPEPTPELQAAMEVLGQKNYFESNDLTLQETDLRQIWLRGRVLTGAYLRGANLDNAVLGEADLREAELEHVNLQCAKLVETDFRCASLLSANLRGADLREANLREAKLHNADLFGANLTNALVSADQVRLARNWQYAFYDMTLFSSLGLQLGDHNRACQEWERSCPIGTLTPVNQN